MHGIHLRDIDTVYALMSGNMNLAGRVRYCQGLINLTYSYISSGNNNKNTFKKKMAADTIAAAQNELHDLLNYGYLSSL